MSPPLDVLADGVPGDGVHRTLLDLGLGTQRRELVVREPHVDRHSLNGTRIVPTDLPIQPRTVRPAFWNSLRSE